MRAANFITPVAVLFGTLAMRGQDPQFTQFYANPLYLNPAFAGTGMCPRTAMNYRVQWPGIEGTYITSSASYDQHVRAMNGGVGVLLTNDNIARGLLETNTASFIYSYHIEANKDFAIRTALQATYFQKQLDHSRLTYGDMIDPRRGFVWNTNEAIPDQSVDNADFSAGILGYGRQFFFGAAVHHLNTPNEGLLGGSELPAKVTIHGGGLIQLEKREEHYISPNILFQAQQKFTQLNLGLYYIRGPFVCGLWYRNADAVIALVGVQNKQMKFGYSYDVTVSKLAGSSAGSHEISLQIQFNCKKPVKKYRLTSCPSF
jgi:type IX secretion system PorP/SprF family membrane protein